MYVQAREEAWKFLTDMTSIFFGMLYWGGGTAVPVCDAPKKARMVFTNANVKEGKFTYKGTQRRVRSTVAVVQFNDPNDNFKLQPVVVEDFDGIFRYGVQTKETTAFACTSRGQARRVGKYILRNEISNTDTVSFRAGAELSLLRPCDIIEVFDTKRAAWPCGGRIIGLAHQEDTGFSIVTTDRPIPDSFLDANPNTFSFVCMRAQGFLAPSEVVDDSNIDDILKRQMIDPIVIAAFSTDSAGNRIIILTQALPLDIEVGTVWGLRSAAVSPMKVRVLGVQEVSKNEFELAGVEWNAELFAEVDSDVPYSEQNTSLLNTRWNRPNPPTGLELEINSKLDASDVLLYTLSAFWSRPLNSFVKGYEVFLQKGLGNYQFVTSTANTHVDFTIPEADNYCVRVRAVGMSEGKSDFAEACTIVGTLTGENQELISGLEITGQSNVTDFATGDVSFDWRVNWSGASSDYEQLTGVVAPLPPGVREYLVRITDVDGNHLLDRVRQSSDFTLTLDQNRSLADGPYREFIISVRARTTDGAVSSATSLRVRNVKPPAPVVDLVNDSAGNMILTITGSSSADFRAFAVFRSTTPGFTPNLADLVFLGSSSVVTLAGTNGVTYYYRVGELDVLSSDSLDCDLSAQQSVTATKIAGLTIFDFLP
jgi:hypothetical protein